MENKNGSDISANELLEKLKANMAGTETANDDGRKKYKFRRSERIVASVSEDDIQKNMPTDEQVFFESPVPKSDIEDLDIDALMKKYLPEEDYNRMASKDVQTDDASEFVRTLSSFDIEDEGAEDGTDTDENDPLALTAPDTELYEHLSYGGKVCDVPDLEKHDDMSDTRQAPLRPMSDVDRTIAFGGGDDEDEGGFISIRELMGMEQEDDTALNSEDTVVADLSMFEDTVFVQDDVTEDEAQMSETVVTEAVTDDEEEDELVDSDTRSFEALKELFMDEESENDEIEDEIEDEIVQAEPELEKEEEAVPALESVYEDEEPVYDEQTEEELTEDDFDETDANIMLAFGMDDELDKAMGKESADKLRSEMEDVLPEEEEKNDFSEEDDGVKEFVSPTEIKGIFENYKNEYGKNALSMFAMIAVCIVLFFYENIGIFGGQLPEIFSPKYYPVVNVMAGLQVLFIGFAVLYKSVISGFKSLVEKKPTVESFLPVMLMFAVIYSVLSCFFTVGAPIVGFNFPIALSLLFYVIGKRLDLRREIMTFKIISSKRGKFALEKLDIIDAELETKAFDKFLPSQPEIFRINKTSFIDGYFTRTKAYSSIKTTLMGFIPATIVSSVLGIIIGAVASGTFHDAIMTGYGAFVFCTPLTVFMAFSLPMFRSSKVSYDNNSAIVGESSLDEYTSASSISFDDREVFPSAGVKLRSIKVFGSGRLDNAIYYMASVYAHIGGPLSDVLNVATADIGRSKNSEILNIETDGIEAVVDGHHLYAGRADYLRHNGYLPVTDPEDEEIEGGDICITFLVCDDEVIAKFYTRYRIDPEFQNTLKSMYRSGICVGIKTVDPNINDEMLGTRIRLTKYPVRVLKYNDLNDRSRGSDRTDSGIVSKKSVKALLKAFTLCDKTKHITKTNLLICALAVVIGLCITAAVAFISTVSAVSSVYVALFQIFFMIPVYLISKFLIM